MQNSLLNVSKSDPVVSVKSIIYPDQVGFIPRMPGLFTFETIEFIILTQIRRKKIDDYLNTLRKSILQLLK